METEHSEFLEKTNKQLDEISKINNNIEKERAIQLELLGYNFIKHMDEISEEYNSKGNERAIEVISAVFSALVSTLVSNTFACEISQSITFQKGVLLLQVIVLICLHWMTYKGVTWIFKQIKFYNEDRRYAKRIIKYADKRRLIEQFDVVASAGMTLSEGYINMYKEYKDSESKKEYYLFKAFYYLKKTVDVINQVLYYMENYIDTENGIPMYRVKNMVSALTEVWTAIESSPEFSKEETRPEKDIYVKRWNRIKNVINNKEKNSSNNVK